jgi:peptidyl-prolyl cis-trans isomerase SurA
VVVNEAFARTQKDIRISHITVLVDKKSTDTAAAFKKINEAYSKLKNGIAFANVAKLYSEDPNATNNGGDLGYVTAFALPYNLENLAYNTPLNKYSPVTRSNVGYHIFMKTEERNAVGKMKAAQILIQIFPNDNGAAKNQIDDIYRKLEKGEIFENLARTFSNDVQTASGGGYLQEFAVGKFDPLFESTFYSLKKDTYSKPFKTEFGWHILKRIDNTPPPSSLTKEYEAELIAKINNDSRKEKIEQSFLQTILKTVNYKQATFDKDLLLALTNKKFYDTKTIVVNNMDENVVLHSFKNQNITVGNFWSFVKDAKTTSKYSAFTPGQMLDEYVKITAFEHYKNNLELYSPEFKAQVKEFKDGNLLFEAMERKVWNKSANDEAGLKKYYNANNKKYLWGKSADAILFNALNLADANAARDSLQKTNWRDVVVRFQNSISADSGRYELSTIMVADRTNFQEGMTTVPFSPNNDGNFIFAYIIKIYPEGGIRNFEDAKGLVINDYQTVLEEEWITALKKKYAVKVNDAVWKSILK